MDQEHDESLDNTGHTEAFKILQEQGVCLGYASTSIAVCFEPSSAAEHEEDIEIVCSVKRNGPVHSVPERFKVHLQVSSLLQLTITCNKRDA